MKKIDVLYEKIQGSCAFWALFFKLIEALFELFVPLVVADIIDVGIESGDKGYIISRGLLMAGLGLIGFICAVTAQYFCRQGVCRLCFKPSACCFQ